MPGECADVAEGGLAVREDEAGLRLDAFLARRQIVSSSSAARRAVAAGVVRVNGRAAQKGLRLETGDVVALEAGPRDRAVLEPAPDLDLRVLYEDHAIVAVDKPPGVHSHPLRPGDGPTVAAALVARFPECARASPDAREGGLGHRLDVGTSGVLLAARSPETWYRLRAALAGPLCEKTYLAEVSGVFPDASARLGELVLPGPSPASFVVTAPIGRQGRHGGRVKVGAGRQPLPCRTEVTLLERGTAATLVEARLARGRAHQVRAHLAHLGVPVRGDGVYGEPEEGAGLRLHAWRVSLAHPTSGRLLRIEAPAPGWATAYSNWAMLVSTRR
jgi:23S rRNA pseudouridine1911/1915/1917 synthase